MFARLIDVFDVFERVLNALYAVCSEGAFLATIAFAGLFRRAGSVQKSIIHIREGSRHIEVLNTCHKQHKTGLLGVSVQIHRGFGRVG